jgi:hypothetical protein
MAITQAMCTSFKTELLTGTHNFTNSSGNSFKLALYAIGGGGNPAQPLHLVRQPQLLPQQVR